MAQIDIQQAKDRFLELCEIAAGGEEVIISKDDHPLVKLTPIVAQTGRRPFGSDKGLITMTAHFDEPLEDFREYS